MTRKTAAVALCAIGDNAAREPRIRAMTDPLTHADRGTIVRALQPLDYSGCLRFLVQLTLTDTCEVQNHALQILYEQEFWYTQSSSWKWKPNWIGTHSARIAR